MKPKRIEDDMTAVAETIAAGATLAEADRRMQEMKIRHLPVVDGGRLVGIVSQGDLHLVEGIGGLDADEVTVARAMTPEPYTVPIDETLEEVARVMADNRVGSVIVLDGGEIAGIFTHTDAVRVLSELLAEIRQRSQSA